MKRFTEYKTWHDFVGRPTSLSATSFHFLLPFARPPSALTERLLVSCIVFHHRPNQPPPPFSPSSSFYFLKFFSTREIRFLFDFSFRTRFLNPRQEGCGIHSLVIGTSRDFSSIFRRNLELSSFGLRFVLESIRRINFFYSEKIDSIK